MPEPADVPPQTCPACGSAVNVAEAEPLARVTCPGCGEKFRVESAFDNFVLVETLGVGGMGSVYKARDTRLQRFVALKVLRKELSADPAEAARLEEEARVTAAINHPNVIQVYSSSTARGQIYLVMELVDHGSLDDLMAQNARVSERQVLETGIQVARGLQAAQAKGLVHRDVKPANILFADAQTAKIGDFGLAGAAEAKADARKEIWGTPYYVAPERLDNAPEDFRSDIYSLGATLFHALAGQPPMQGETTSASELRKLKSNPPSLRSVAPDVSRETARVIDRTLAPDPAARFGSYQELIDALQDALTPESRRSPARRLRTVLALGAALALAAAAGAYALHKRNAAHAQPPVAATSPKVDTSAALQQRYENARRALVDGKFDSAATAFAAIASDPGAPPLLQNWARLHLGLAALLQGKMPQARDAFQQIERAGPIPNAKGDAPLDHFFSESAKALAAPGPIRGVPELSGSKADPFALFLFGIKDWALREFDEAAGLLKRFAESPPPNEFKWIADYQPIARRYLGDHAVYSESKALPARFSNPAEARAAVEKVRALQKRVQTDGVLAEALKDEEKRLNSAATNLEKAEKDAREREQKALLAKESQLWEPALAEARTKISAYDFAGALAAIDHVPLKELSLKQAQSAEHKKAGWLVEWKSKLISDLKTGALKTPISIAGTEYQGATGADAHEIMLRIGQYGGAPFKWEKFPPNTLLAMSTGFMPANAPDLADRQWLAAVFAQATGEAEAAKQLAEAAAKAKPEYAAELKTLALP